MLIGVLVAPWIAYFSSIVLWLGSGDPPVIFLVSFVTTPAFVFATVAGLRSADPSARELLAAFSPTGSANRRMSASAWSKPALMIVIR